MSSSSSGSWRAQTSYLALTDHLLPQPCNPARLSQRNNQKPECKESQSDRFLLANHLSQHVGPRSDQTLHAHLAVSHLESPTTNGIVSFHHLGCHPLVRHRIRSSPNSLLAPFDLPGLPPSCLPTYSREFDNCHHSATRQVRLQSRPYQQPLPTSPSNLGVSGQVTKVGAVLQGPNEATSSLPAPTTDRHDFPRPR